MRILRVSGQALMLLDRFDVEFSSGLTVVTGKNGEGKSSLAEAASAALYGETIRGTPFWRKGEECQVKVETDSLIAERIVSTSGKKSLSWSLSGESPRSYGTPSKSQEDLSRHVPPFEVWRRTFLFSSDDASLFSLARDSQRKELLEHLLGVEKFDDALDGCRKDLRTASMELAEMKSSLSRSRAVLEEKKARLEDAEQLTPELDATSEWFELRGIERSIRTDEVIVETFRKTLDGLRRDDVRFHSERSVLEKKRKLVELDCCPTCEREIDPSFAEKVLREVSISEESMVRECTLLNEAMTRLELQTHAVKEHVEFLRERSAILRGFVRDEERAQRERAKVESTVAAIADSVRQFETSILDLEGEISSLERRSSLLQAVEQVLGLRGVRSKILARGLESLDVLSNAKLERMLPGAMLKLSPYTERKSGAVADSISLQVFGVGGDLGYPANSKGQKRRIDLSLLLGLSEMADAAAGRKPGTVFFDEAFDALDLDGVAIVSEILVEMSRRRPVVLISHNADLVESLIPEAELRLHVENHRVSEVKKRSREGTKEVESYVRNGDLSRTGTRAESSTEAADRGEVRTTEANPSEDDDRPPRPGKKGRARPRRGGSAPRIPGGPGVAPQSSG